MDFRWLQSQFKLHPEKTKAELAKALGLDAPAISKILSGKRQIKAHEYVGMRTFFGLPNDGSRNVRQQSDTRYVIDTLSDQKSEDNQDAWVMPASIFENKTKAPSASIKIFKVQEDAMMPDFMRGEHVLVDLSDTKPSPAGVFIVSDGIGHILRQCELVPHYQPLAVKISAIKERYDTNTVTLEKAGIVGRVIAKLQWL